MVPSLEDIAALPDQKQKIEQYKAALQAIVAAGSLSEANAFVDHMLSEAVPLVVSRQLLTVFANDITKLPPDVHKATAQHALDKVQSRVVSYEEQVTIIREHLAALHEQEEEWSQAANTLAGIDLDLSLRLPCAGMRQLDNEYKLGKNIKIAMLYLEDDDAVNAEIFIKKASVLIANCKDETLELQYKTSYVRVLDSKRRFLEAATRYYELSQLSKRDYGGKMVEDDELEQALQAAAVCTILAAAGPQRSRVLANLYKDERSPKLPVFPLLEKVYLERILRRDEVDAFAQLLKPHQRALLPDGSTVLDRAVVEHNLAAAARLYVNIYTAQLGTLLGVAPEKAEAVAARMVQEDRLKASIDQVEGLIRFDTASEQLLQWDEQIQGVCSSLNNIIDRASAKQAVKMEA